MLNLSVITLGTKFWYVLWYPVDETTIVAGKMSPLTILTPETALYHNTINVRYNFQDMKSAQLFVVNHPIRNALVGLGLRLGLGLG